MGLVIGPSKSHSSYAALGSTFCGGRVFCRSGGIAWIVAPAGTEVIAMWSDTTYTLVGNKPCVSDWSSLSTALTNAGLTPSDWFVPSITQLYSGSDCRTYWDFSSSTNYWSSTEHNACSACFLFDGNAFRFNKAGPFCVRAFRCVTY